MFLFETNLATEVTDEAHNTPAGDHWTLSVQFIRSNESLLSDGINIPIVFLPTGEIDFTRTSADNLSIVNAILSPTISLLQDMASESDVELDFWRLINWLYVESYWIMLTAFGQYSPTIYDNTPDSLAPNFSTALSYPPTNNIFVNNTLYEIYSEFTLNTVLPLVGMHPLSARVAPLVREMTSHSTKPFAASMSFIVQSLNQISKRL